MSSVEIPPFGSFQCSTRYCDVKLKTNIITGAEPITATIARRTGALVTSSSKPYRTLADLVAAAKRGERPIYASQSPLTKIVADYIAGVAGVKFRVISVQGGGETMQAVLGGHADFAFSGGPHIDYVAAGKMRVLATTEDERSPTAPDVPTLTVQYTISTGSGWSRKTVSVRPLARMS